MVLSKIMTHISGKVQTQPDGAALTHEFFKKGLPPCFGYFFTNANSIIRKKLL